MLETYIDARLAVWAAWRAKRDDSGLGYPKQSAFTKLAPTKSSNWTPDLNNEAYELDQCISALIEVRREAIMQMYTHTSTIKEKSAACFCCERTFFYRLHMAKRDLVSFLNDLSAGIQLPTKKSA